MNIYLVRQDISMGYDTYDSFVCVANDEDEAKSLAPVYGWCDKDLAEVTLIGTATPESSVGVIIRSYNAG